MGARQVAEAFEKIRAFIAVRVDAEVERAIAELVAQLRSHGDGVKWTSPANLHLTLKFLGPAVAAEKIRLLEPELLKIAGATEAFDLEASGIGGFPDLKRPQVLWVGLRGDALRNLAARVEEACARFGFERERRAFNGHLTIGRLKRARLQSDTRGRVEAVMERNFGSSTIREMTLYRSITASAGPIYEALSKFQFKSPE